MNEWTGWERWKRGDICVARSIGWLDNKCVVRLADQSAHREWLGCFSIVGV